MELDTEQLSANRFGHFHLKVYDVISTLVS